MVDYKVGDVFFIDDQVEAVVAHVNQGMAWLTPNCIYEVLNKTFRDDLLLIGVAFVKLNEKGRTPWSTKAIKLEKSNLSYNTEISNDGEIIFQTRPIQG